MALRVRKSFKVCPGVRLNVGKKSMGISFGTRGLRYSINSTGRRTKTVGIPGTGISYTSSSSTNNKREQLQGQKLDELQQNTLMVEEYNNLIAMLTAVHQECDDFVDWVHINSLPPPYNPPEIGPHKAQAISEYQNFTPGFFERIFKSLENNKRKKLEQAIVQAELQDKQEYEEWQNLNILSSRVLQGDIDAYFQVIEEMNPLDDLLEWGSDFEFTAQDGTTLEVEFTVKTDSIVPKDTLSLTKTGKLSQKAMPKKQYYQLVQDYVCSCSIRIARDITALLPVQRVIVHAVDNVLNTVTGFNEDIVVLSAEFNRDILNELNFALINPSDALQNFPHNMKFLKTAGLKPVKKIRVTRLNLKSNCGPRQ